MINDKQAVFFSQHTVPREHNQKGGKGCCGINGALLSTTELKEPQAYIFTHDNRSHMNNDTLSDG
jgi:hypothetical protein